MIALHNLKQVNPQDNQESRKQFFSKFDLTDSKIDTEAQKAIEGLPVESHDIFTGNRFDIGINYDFNVKLTPFHENPAYSHCLPTPISLKEDITVELASLYKYAIITTLPFSKYANPIFAQRKPNGKLRLYINIRKVKNLKSDDYKNNNHPVSTQTDAAHHIAGKNLFCKFDWSQAYHCLEIADQRSVELLAFTLARTTFAYRR